MGQRNAKLTAAAVVLALSLVACGGGEARSPRLNGEASGLTPTSTDVADQSGGPGGGSTTSVPGKTGAAAGSSGTTSSTAIGGTTTTDVPQEMKPPLPLEATLGAACVRAGGQQSISIKTVPESAVGYDSTYSDGKSGISEGFYGGNNGTLVGPEGTWSDTWAIAPTAPPGVVRVLVKGANWDFNFTDKELSFQLVGPTGICT